MINNVHYSQTQTAIANDFSYHPIPYFEDQKSGNANYSRKLDLNLYCIKRPQQTCFIHITDPDMLAWGIEKGDMLVVEKSDSLAVGDLIVLDLEQKMEIYEFVTYSNGEFIFVPLRSKAHSIKTRHWADLPIVGTVTNTIHQIKPRRDTMKFAA
ncbi:type VI secretion protein ImpA [Pasteurellaceae bacterium Pebbles2]|nr:type VI secretion protein ImpA [Pasteurellaceae bacterium Pebbles2]